MRTNLLRVFCAFLKIGLLSFGGGYSALALIQNEICEKNALLTADEFGSLVALAESTPGPIALNGATFTGFHVAGFFGALAATVGFLAPPAVFTYVLCRLTARKKTARAENIYKYVRAAVSAIVLSSAVSMARRVFFTAAGFNFTLLAVAVCAFLAFKFLKFNILAVFLLSAAAGVCFIQ